MRVFRDVYFTRRIHVKAEAKTEQVTLDKLTPHPDNPRVGHIPAIKESIQTNGWYGAVIAQKSTGHVLAGNHRIEAAKQLEIESVPVIWVDVDDERAKAILLADNRTNDLAVYDDEILSELLDGLDTLEGTGWSTLDLDRLLEEVNPEPGDWKDPEDGLAEDIENMEDEHGEGIQAVLCPECGHTIEL